MSSVFNNLAEPAPLVETPMVDRVTAETDSLHVVEPARASESTYVKPAQIVEPAVTVDDPKKFAPKLKDEEISHLSVAALREYGSDFESTVRIIVVSCCCGGRGRYQSIVRSIQ